MSVTSKTVSRGSASKAHAEMTRPLVVSRVRRRVFCLSCWLLGPAMSRRSGGPVGGSKDHLSRGYGFVMRVVLLTIYVLLLYWEKQNIFLIIIIIIINFCNIIFDLKI